jgi:hypothetical protein
VAQAPPCLNALAQQLHGSGAIQDQQPHPGFCGHGLHAPAMAAVQEGGIHDHRKPRGQPRRRLQRQPLLKQLLAHRRGIGIAVAGWLQGLAPQAEQALALHIRADPDRLQGFDQGGAVVRLAGPREAMAEQQQPGPALADPLCQLQIGPHLFALAAEGRHLGAHHGAVAEVPAPEQQADVVATALQPAVEHAHGQAGETALLQVHHQKGQVADHIDPAQGRTEFEAVEGLDPPLLQHQVAQMQIAMALAHPARRQPLGKTGLQAAKLLLGPALQLPHLGLQRTGSLRAPPRRARIGRPRAEQGVEIGQHRRPHGNRAAERRLA